MLKKFIEKRFSKKAWRYVKVGLGVAALVFVGYILWQIFTPSGAEHTSSSFQVKEFTERRLVAIPAKEILGGVLAGFAYYFAFPLWLLRILFVLAVLFFDDDGISDFLIIAYILLWIFMPAIDFIPADFVARTGG